MALVLVVDDDVSTMDFFARVLRSAGHDVRTSTTGREALQLIGHIRFDCALCHLRLPDLSGLQIVEHIRTNLLPTACVVVSGVGSMLDGVRAVRLGAAVVLAKPVSSSELLASVDTATRTGENRRTACTTHAHATERWAQAMLSAIASGVDPKTVSAWALCACTSPGTLRTWCAMARVKPKLSLNLARALRAWTLWRTEGTSPENALDIADPRTLKRLLAWAGMLPTMPATLDGLLAAQRFVTSTVALEQLRRALNPEGDGNP